MKTKVEVYPSFSIAYAKDLMIKGREFYAVYDEETGLWSEDEYDVARLVDKEIRDVANEVGTSCPELDLVIKWMNVDDTNSWAKYRRYIKQLPDNYHPLDTKLLFLSDEPQREDYASKKLPYDLNPNGRCTSYNKLMDRLYAPEERQKLEWMIGAIFCGDSPKIQKFITLYGEAGTGKSTVLNIIEKLFHGYTCSFDAKAIGAANNSFALESFKGNPLVAINHDGDLSKIEDNTKFNSLVSHEKMLINEKFKSQYTAAINAILFIGTNQPVRISDSKSGLLRRLIDVMPTGQKFPPSEYNRLMGRIDFELGAIAAHCIDVYRKLGIAYYNGYRPVAMQYRTDVFYNFMEDNYLFFETQDGVSLRQAWDMYKMYCSEAAIQYVMPKFRFKSELENYFYEFKERAFDSETGKQLTNYYKGLRKDKFNVYIEANPSTEKDDEITENDWLKLSTKESILDVALRGMPAQYANRHDHPQQTWETVTTQLQDLDTSKVHYVKVPPNHIVIDFDLKDKDGKKSLRENVEAARKFPPTYAEVSKGSSGLHLHYIYEGDVDKLCPIYAPDIEVKVFKGNAALRRRLTRCCNLEIAHINSGLPLKTESKPPMNYDAILSEQYLRTMIRKNLHKEIHPNTRPSIDFIKKILDDAYNAGLQYDVTDLRQAVLLFAMGSTNQKKYCVATVGKMKFKSEDEHAVDYEADDTPIVFFDIEVFPNLFLINWKFAGTEKTCSRMINPSPEEVLDLFQYRLVGFNCRRYDNHLLYARAVEHYDNEELYKLSKKIIDGKSKQCFFREAYSLSYTDVYDFCSKKQSLKKWEIELGIHHKELGLPWDEPVPESQWAEVAEYCDNDVLATEAVFNARNADFVAREILAKISGLTLNDTTNSHTARIIFGNDKKPGLVYTDLATGIQYMPGERGPYDDGWNRK